MSDKKFDPVAEQRRRQQEFIEFKKQSEGALPPPERAYEVCSPKGFRAKAENIWYHYKYYIIFVPIAIAVFAVLVAQCAATPKYDYTVLLNSTQYVSEDDSEILAEIMAKYGEDLNGDGKVAVDVVNCTRNQSGKDAQTIQAKAQKFLAEVATGKARIIIVNREIFDQFNTEELLMWTDHFTLPEFDGKALDSDNTSLECLSSYKEKYYICYRISDSYDTADARLFEKFIGDIQKSN